MLPSNFEQIFALPRPLPVTRILAGPFDGHLDHKAVQKIFRPYGNVQGGGWYHRLNHVLRTYGFVDFETEAEVNHVIQCLTQGSFRSHGKHLRMIKGVTNARLPMGLDDWINELSRGWSDETTIGDADDESKAARSPSHVKDDETTEVGKDDESKATESSSHVKDDDSTDVGKGDESKAAEPSSHVKIDDSTEVDKGDKGEAAKPPGRTKIQVVIPAPLSAAHHHNSKYFDVFDKT